MCGRYTQHHSTDQVVMRFDVTTVVQETRERYNIAPTQMAPVIIQQEGLRILEAFKRGLIPFWAKEASIGNKMLNARAETLAEKPAFDDAILIERSALPMA
jgi:putative SOS response-associated peptidase YedK